MAQLARRVQIFVCRSASAASSGNVDGQQGTTIDMQGFDGCLFLSVFGTGSTGGNNNFSINGATASTSGTTLSGATFTNTASSSATVDYAVIDVYRPAGYRFLTPVQSAASSCEAIGPILAFLYGPNVQAPSTNLGGPAFAGSTAGGVRSITFAVSPTT